MTTLWQTVWSASPVSGRLVVVAIVAVVALAIVRSVHHFARYRRELAQIERVSRWIADALASPAGNVEGIEAEADGAEGVEAPQAPPERDSPLDSAHPGLVDLGQLELATDPATLIGDRVRAIGQLRRHRVKVDLDTLQELALYRDAAAPGFGFPAHAAGLSMMLGILGTFLGLAAMVQEIDLGLPAEGLQIAMDGAALGAFEQLREVMGGMKTAFSTSLVGITGAIVCSGTAFRLAGRRRQVFEALERLSATRLIPATVPAVEDEHLVAQVSRQLDDSFTRLDEIQRQNQESLKDLASAQEACVAIVEQVREITRGQAARQLDEVLAQLARSSEAVLGVSRQLPGIVSAVEATARAVRESIRTPFTASNRSSGGSIFGLRAATWLALVIGIAAAVAAVGLANALAGS